MKTKRILSIVLALAMLLGVAAVGGSFSLEAQAAAPLCNVGDIIEFGSYPQSRVTDPATLMNLIKQSITWNSYGYLSGDGSYASTAPVDWLQYADVTYNGNKYRAVRFSQYRPEQTRLQCSAANSLQDDNGYSSGTVYWFKYEPIKWRVLDPSTGLVLSEVCLDAREYSAIIRYDYYYQSSYISAYYDDEGWANRYEHNNQIRHWLNDTFLNNVAFNSEERGKILYTSLDLYEHNDVVVNDKIFLLSKEDLSNPSHGFSSAGDCKARCTDYAAAQGCQIVSGYSPWWVRNMTDSSDTRGLYAVTIKTDGITGFDDIYHYLRVDTTYIGVRPAMRLNLPMILVGDVSVTGVTAPVAGATASFNYTVPSGAGYVKDSPKYAAWVETDTQPTGFDDLSEGTYHWNDGGSFTFKPDKYYTFRADVVADENFIFSDSLSAKINGITAKVQSYSNYKSIWYCFGKTAAASTVINTVTVTGVTAPVVGATASFNYTIPSGAGYVKDGVQYAAWIETDTEPTTFSDLSSGKLYWVTGSGFNFKPDKYYTFRADVSANDGYTFSSSLTAKINGNTAKVQSQSSYKTVWYCFGKTASSIAVTGVTLNKSTLYLASGDTATLTATVAPSDATNKAVTWSSSNTTVATVSSTGVVTAKAAGTATITVRTADGGKTASCAVTVLSKINSVTITGVTAPVAGAAPSYNYTLPSGAGYVKDSVPNSAWIETDTQPTTYGDLSSGTTYWVSDSGFTFKPDKYYTFLAYVRESSGYAFSSSLTAKINGNTAKVQSYSSYKTVWYCFGKTASITKTLTSIAVTTQPTKKTYTAGESFNKAGMVVKANYSDSTSATITGYTVTNGNNLTAGQTSVTLSYTEGGITKTATVAITVSSATATLTGIELTSPPTTTTYTYKKAASTAGMKVTAKYSDNTTQDVTGDVSISGLSTSQKGTFNATVSFEGKTATFSYTVKYTWWQWIIVIVLFGWLWY